MKKKISFTDDEALYYFTMILLGVSFLHYKGITHRDLKPANILIDRISGKIDVLKIGDFGISKVEIDEITKTNSTTLG
jgi:serine/threonine protein kinase